MICTALGRGGEDQMGKNTKVSVSPRGIALLERDVSADGCGAYKGDLILMVPESVGLRRWYEGSEQAALEISIANQWGQQLLRGQYNSGRQSRCRLLGCKAN